MVNRHFTHLIGFHVQDYVLEKGEGTVKLYRRYECVWNQSLVGIGAGVGACDGSGRARETCEDYPRVESTYTRRHVVRGDDGLLTLLQRSGWAILHGLFDACGHRVPLGGP
jgi:hypothetical protein